MGKKGLSPIIASVLLIMLSVVAVAAIYGFIVPFVKDNMKESTECLNYRDYFFLDGTFNYNCYDERENVTLISVGAKNRENTEEAESLVMVIYNGETKEEINLIDGITNEKISVYQENGNIIIPKKGDVVTYRIVTPYVPGRIEVKTMIKGGKICDSIEGTSIRACIRKN